jgi:cardiolipin synthase
MKQKETMEHKAAGKNGVLRMVFVVLSLVLEIGLLVLFFFRLNQYFRWFQLITFIVGLLLVLVIYGQHKTSAMKMPWIILIMAAPVLGITLYFLIGLNGSTRKMRNRYEKIDALLFPVLHGRKETLEALEQRDPDAGAIADYINHYAHYPVWQNTDVTYYNDAADGLEAQLRDLKRAEQFIFMEYHAIEDKESWRRIEEVLVDRVHAGVEVRVFYDDMGSIGFINTDFTKKMERLGIQCRVFNPFAPGLNIFLNNRDHRKITVIDNKIGFTGGYNLANEYFNLTADCKMKLDN